MKTFKTYILALLLCLCGQTAMAQGQGNFIDGFYESGKIKVVIASVFIVLAILIFILVRLDRKLTKLEKEN